MTQTEINEGNEIIARFDGAKFNGGTTLVQDEWCQITELEKGFKTLHYVEGVTNGLWTSNVLRYDTDWNWLIPICQRLLFEIKMEIEQDPFAILGGDDERKKELRRTRNKIEQSLLSMKIEVLHPIIVDGIKLINNNEQTINKINESQ